MRSTSTSCASPKRCSIARVEAAILDDTNPRVLDGHVRAAAFEAPLDDADRDILGDAALERAALLPELQANAGRLRLAGRDHPAARVPLRSTSPDSFSVIEARRPARCWAGRARARVLDRPRRSVDLHLGEAYLRANARPRGRPALV